MAIINNLPPKKKGGGWQISTEFKTVGGTTHRYNENVLLPNITAEASSHYVWSQDYTYNGSIQSVQVPKTGRYKLEAWGGQGQNAGTSSGSIGGYGGYATGEIELQAGTTLYICCGGQGNNGTNATSGTATYAGGYNGGGTKTSVSAFPSVYGGAGGGATHIALRTGTLSSIGSSNLSDVLIVAGGGGGGVFVNTANLFRGGNGGGTTGQNGTGQLYGVCGTQTSAGRSATGIASITSQSKFGQGASGGIASGGGGLYGGGAGNITSTSAFGSGAGGSGYVSSQLTNTSMTSTAAGSSTPTSNRTKIGAGAVHIELLEELPDTQLTDLTNTQWLISDSPDLSEDFNYSINFVSNNETFNEISSYHGEILNYGETEVFNLTEWNNNAYKTIMITGGANVTDTDLINWLLANATQIVPNGYSVIITNNTNENAEIYDGQDTNGTYLGTILADATETYTITSGYVYTNQSGFYFFNENTLAQSNPIIIENNCTISIAQQGGTED